MTEAGWGIGAWLPPAVQRQMEREAAAEAREAKRSEEAREVAAEEWAARNLTMYREAAAARGELIGAVSMARGEVPGRTVAAVLGEALAASNRQDAVDMARLHRDGQGQPERLHVEFSDPVLHHPPSPAGLQIRRRGAAFLERAKARRQLERAEEREQNVLPLRETVAVRELTRGPSFADRVAATWGTDFS